MATLTAPIFWDSIKVEPKPPKPAQNVRDGIPGAQRNRISKLGPSTWKESTRTAAAPRVVF
ncbi:hypothetical protein BYT27DRAFT_6672647 [Phlegmacium glaucopus]|nr:hypothetical protein BYT27DRAFT_6672647 [Phlegmacium glaucopus]